MRLMILMAGVTAVVAVAAAMHANARQGAAPSYVRLMTLDPGHFHAALIQKEMYEGVAPRVHVFAPLGWDLFEHLKRIATFNTRADRPTAWEIEVHASDDFAGRLFRERPGNVIVLSGRNRPKIGHIVAAVNGGLHVLADKPWIIRSEDLPQVERALAEADAKEIVAYDVMTERFEITTVLQRAMVNDPATFGTILPGTEADPSVYLESVHYLMKTVAGVPNIRPGWFFDTGETGEALSDVGTHLVDLVPWTLFPEQAVDRADIRLTRAYRWPTMIPEREFRRVTGLPGFPPALAGAISGGALEFFCNTLVSYALRGIHTTLNVIWDWEAASGAGDSHFAFYKGSRARVEVRQTRADRHRPELYVIPNEPAMRGEILEAVRAKVGSLIEQYPGIGVQERGVEIHVTVPDALRAGHEAHFAEVARNFFHYLADRRALPLWERANMLAKYYVTTAGTELSRRSPVRVAPRRAPE